MIVTPIKTRPLLPPQDDLLAVLEESLPEVPEKSVIAVSSKIVAIWQGRCEAVPEQADLKTYKEELAKREASVYLEKDERYPHARLFTINEGVLGSTSGIDESNGNGYLVLLPKDANAASREIQDHIKKIRKVKELGVIMMDSRSAPMRNGVRGIALGHFGFEALYDYRGREDIFERPLKYERINVADCLATAATLVVGEGDECTPLALISEIPHIVFSEKEVADPLLQKTVAITEDVFARFFKDQPWKHQ